MTKTRMAARYYEVINVAKAIVGRCRCFAQMSAASPGNYRFHTWFIVLPDTIGHAHPIIALS